MTIDWPAFLSATVLLLLPLLIPKNLANRLSSGSVTSVQASVLGLLRYSSNWLNLFTACLGTAFLDKWAISVDPQKSGVAIKAAMLKAAILGIGLLLQVVRVRKKVLFLGPVFYLTGITLVLAGIPTGPFAVFVGWLFAIAGKNPHYQLPVMGIALIVAGYVLGELFKPMFMCNVVLVFSLPVLGFLFQKPLIFVSNDAGVKST